MVNQLRACGVFASIKINATGYFKRIKFNDFLLKYQCLKIFNTEELDFSAAEKCQNIVSNIFKTKHSEKVLFGLTKVFFLKPQFITLENEYVLRQTGAKKIQSCWRMFQQRSKYQILRQVCIFIQNVQKGKHERKIFLRKKNSGNKKSPSYAIACILLFCC